MERKILFPKAIDILILVLEGPRGFSESFRERALEREGFRKRGL